MIQIPCLNEEATLARTLADLPRSVPGFDEVVWLVIDDGSTDRTVEVAREAGVDHIVSFPRNKGLAVAFQTGLDAALKLGADAIVNTDADNQYSSADIAEIVRPIVDGTADFVIGSRDIANHAEFTTTKKVLQRVGSWVVRQASGTDVPDATSGFRAYNREAALRVNVVSAFSYTLETVIQAGKDDIAVGHVPVRTNPTTRPSRLFSSKRQYIRRSATTILRIYAMHEPLRVFLYPAIVFGAVGALLFARFGWFFLNGDGSGHIQSLIVGAVALVMAVQLIALGVIGDLLRANRLIGERTLRRVRGLELAAGIRPEGRASAEATTPPASGSRSPVTDDPPAPPGRLRSGA